MNRRKNADTRRANHRPVRRRKPDKNSARQEKQLRRVLSAQDTIPYREMAKDGICRVHDNLYSKTIRFFDLNYQLAQAEDKDAIFEGWCEFLNYFDFTIHVQLSFVNHHSATLEFDHSIQIEPQHDQFDDLRQEYSNMLKEQLEKGNNGLVRTKYITFAIEADSIRIARPKLERIEADILNNFKVLGVVAYPLNGVERLRLMYEFFNPDSQTPFDFSYDMVLKSGMSTKDFIAPTSFRFRKARDFSMGDRLGAASYLQIIAPELSDRMLADFLDMDRDIMINMHIQSIEQSEAIKMVKSKVSDIQKMKIEEQKKAVRSGYDTAETSEEDSGEQLPENAPAIGQTLHVDGRSYEIESISALSKSVHLRDLDFQRENGYPISRVEPYSVVQGWLKEQAEPWIRDFKRRRQTDHRGWVQKAMEIPIIPYRIVRDDGDQFPNDILYDDGRLGRRHQDSASADGTCDAGNDAENLHQTGRKPDTGCH